MTPGPIMRSVQRLFRLVCCAVLVVESGVLLGVAWRDPAPAAGVWFLRLASILLVGPVVALNVILWSRDD